MPNAPRRLDGHQLRPLPIRLKEAQVGVVAEGGVYYASIPHPDAAVLPDRRELEQLAIAAERSRRAAFDEAKQALLSGRHTEATLRLLRWFATREWRQQSI